MQVDACDFYLPLMGYASRCMRFLFTVSELRK